MTMLMVAGDDDDDGDGESMIVQHNFRLKSVNVYKLTNKYECRIISNNVLFNKMLKFKEIYKHVIFI